MDREEETLRKLQRQRRMDAAAAVVAEIAKVKAEVEKLATEADAHKGARDLAATRLERAESTSRKAERVLRKAVEQESAATAEAARLLADEQSVQQAVVTKLATLIEAGLAFEDDRTELEFKGLLFRKILDGKLGERVLEADDEKRFNALMRSFSAGSVAGSFMKIAI